MLFDFGQCVIVFPLHNPDVQDRRTKQIPASFRLGFDVLSHKILISPPGVMTQSLCRCTYNVSLINHTLKYFLVYLDYSE